ncbi:MAG: type IV pilus twitching motility protein PilT [Puniceicoccaceae bacterium]
MRRDLQWLFHICWEEGALDADRIHAAMRGLHPHIELEEVAEMLRGAGWVEDGAFLKRAVREAAKRGKRGQEPPALPVPPENDPAADAPDFSAWAAMGDDDLGAAMREWIRSCQQSGASDLHVTAGARPRVRHHRQIVFLSEDALDPELAGRMNLSLLDESRRARFESEWDLDYALQIGDETGEGVRPRLRVNLMRHKNGISGTYHMARPEVAGLEELGFPNADRIRELLAYHNGIILVAGPVGSGKTTTLASLVNELNDTRHSHIVAIEDPIEVVQPSKGCIVTQRQVGRHTESFGQALKSALREDPDVIVVGEMRDLETIEMAITAAETGHLVIGTLHTRDAANTLNRILDVFPSRQQSQIRSMAADSLRGIICQRLLPATDGGVALACELMVNNSATANIMREAKEAGLESAMQTGRRQGMRTMDDSLVELYAIGRITRETALEHIKNPKLLDTTD